MNIKDCYVGQIVGITVNGDKYIGESLCVFYLYKE